jgi:hypothetical protein
MLNRMRLKIAIRFTKIFLFFLGFGLLGLSLFAVQFGLDHNSTWGKGRIILAGTGSLFLFGWLCFYFQSRMRESYTKLQSSPAFQSARTIGRRLYYRFCTSYPVQTLKGITKNLSNRILRFPPVAYFHLSPRRSAILFSGLGVATTLLMYFFYITNGTFTTWKPYSNYFNRLSDAFMAGKLYLLDPPPTQLLALQNPYDWHNRQGMGYLWDASLYQGKYYFYWGPVPALLLIPVKAILGSKTGIDDQFLLLFFCSGLITVLSLLLVQLRKHFFPDTSAWTLLPFTLMAGLATPVFWLINRPSVYETAIAGGQFFLFVGIYAAFRTLTYSRISARWMLVAGASLGAAVNCRLSLAPAVIFFALITAWISVRNSKDRFRAILQLSYLGLPLILWVAGMGWYNAARFGSILETGHRYQLTGIALPPDYSKVTSLAYLLPNLYSYIFRPFKFSLPDFPHVFLPFIQESMWPWFIHLPKYYYYAEPVAGILIVVPAVWLIFLPVLGWVKRGWLWLHEQSSSLTGCDTPDWVWAFFIGGALLVFAPLLVFISTSMRYLADITPMLSILSALGFWWAARFFQTRPAVRKWLALAAVILVLISITISLLVNFTNGDKRFVTNNPALYDAIARFFQ